MRERPLHLRTRFASPVANGRPAVLVRDEERIHIMVGTHPATAEEMKMLEPAGQYQGGVRCFYLEQQVFTQQADTGSKGDLIEYKGELFRVFDVGDWEGRWKALAERVVPAPDPETAPSRGRITIGL